jgi:protocatechuate 3,4-dioxygenase beta subunit
MRDTTDRRRFGTDCTAWTRRESLKLAGGSAAWLLAGSLPFAARAADEPDCVVRPEQTEGPYFVDERLERSDLRSDPSDGSIRPGVPLMLSLAVSKRSAGACTPLPRARVDIWHCDAQGTYSDVRDPHFDTVGRKFLRGYQMTDATGIARFTTIYPGWYPGRAVHIHFKVRSESSELTSQLYFDDALSERIFAQTPYTQRGRHVPNDQDGIFARGGEELMLRLESAGSGYRTHFHLALET